MKVIIIGAGRVGTAMGYLFAQNGIEILGVYNRHLNSARQAVTNIGAGTAFELEKLKRHLNQADLIMITTPDSQIRKMAEFVIEHYNGGDFCLMHMSGLMTADILQKDGKPAAVFSFHPLQSVANFKEGIRLLPKSVFTIEGTHQGRIIGAELASRLSVNYHYIKPEYKPLYHAAAVITSNYLVTLVNTGFKLYQEIGLDNQEFKDGLLQLIKGTLNNLEKMGPEDALTGPIARGDRETIIAHQQALKEYAPDFSLIYQILGRYTSRLAGKLEMADLFIEEGE